MATAEITVLPSLRARAVHVASGAEIVTDAPVDNHGLGRSFSPTDLTATSLATCMLTIMGIAGQTHGFSIEGATAQVTKTMAGNPRRISEIHIDIQFPPAGYSDKHKEIIQRSAETCPVKYSLHPDIRVTTNYNF